MTTVLTAALRSYSAKPEVNVERQTKMVLVSLTSLMSSLNNM